ncbi:MAG: sigma-70 family RNA polymerase sigma factor [Bdellovibrionota bacterium]
MAALSLEKAFAAEKKNLWGLCYRMTGSTADADDLVQETFRRAIERPPRDQTLPWRPWLARVATNLSLDHLRARRRRKYPGVWLPAPLETPEEMFPMESSSAEKYDLLESVTFAFLLALERLTPRQRAVLLLRDVFDYSVKETADALQISEDNVKTTHLRARQAMKEYEKNRSRPVKASKEQTRKALEKLMLSLGRRDVAAIEELLAADASFCSDGGGEFPAASRAVHGARKVVRVLLAFSPPGADIARFEIRSLNGFPALVFSRSTAPEKWAKKYVFRLDLDSEGKIRDIYSVTASRKLKAVRFDAISQ